MARRWDWRDLTALGILALLPLLACLPALWHERLLTPGDGVFLHYPLRQAVWESYRNTTFPSWNPAVFSGTPLLAAFRPGALYLPALALTWLPPFVAFQLLVLVSLSATAVLVFLYLRQLGAERVGAYFGALSFTLGSYLVNHLSDAATVIAAAPLLLALLGAELFVARGSVKRASLLAAGLALLALAGSPEALRAGLGLVVARLLAAHFLQSGTPRLSLAWRFLPVVAGLLLAAPQLVPSLLTLREAGRQVSGLADFEGAGPGGAAGMVLRYVSHTPAPALAAAALPLLVTQAPVRAIAVVLALCLVLQWGRGPLTAAGALPLLFDLALSLLAGLSLSAQWRNRTGHEGVRLRGYFVAAALVSVAVLPASAATAGPLPQTLAGGVGLLALALILYFSLASVARPWLALAWLLPLSVSFVLQPYGRNTWVHSPERRDLEGRGVTRQTLDRLMAGRRDERVLTLARQWPREAVELAFGNLAATHHLRSANGYDPLTPLRTRALLGQNAGGLLQSPGALRADAALLAVLGVGWVQVPTSALADAPGVAKAEPLDVTLHNGDTRAFALPAGPVTQVRLVSSLSNAVSIPQGTVVALATVHLASGRRFVLPIRAGEETAEWAHDRSDVLPVVRHARARLAESWPGPGGGYEGHRYLARLDLPGRYLVDGVSVEMTGADGVLLVTRLSVYDEVARASLSASLVSAHVSDTADFEEVGVFPALRLFRFRGPVARARVVGSVRTLPDDTAVLRLLQQSSENGVDLVQTALLTEADADGLLAPTSWRSSPATVAAQGGALSLEAEGPGLLVVAESWDAGWAASLAGRPARLYRVNQAQMGVVLPAGPQRVTLRHTCRGFGVGMVLAVGGLLVLAAAVFVERGTRGPAS